MAMLFGLMGRGFGRMGAGRDKGGGWWLPGSTIDLDFQNNRAAVNGAAAGSAQGQLAITRTTSGMAQQQNGLWRNFTSGQFRETDKGLLVEEARTNEALWARDMTNAAWVKSNMTAALNQTGIDGAANAASLLTATAANATCLQTITLSSQAATYSVFLERVTGSGEVDITVDGGTTWTPVTLTGSFALFQVKKTAANPVFGVRIVVNGDAVTADFSQLEPGAFATSPILTTSAAATRNADQVTATNTGLWGTADNSVFFEWLENGPFSIQARSLGIISDASNFLTLGRNGGNKSLADVVSGGTPLLMTAANSVVASTPYRIAVAVAPSDFATAMSASLNSGIITGTGAVPVGAIATVSIGWLQTSGIYGNAYVRSTVSFPSRLSNAQLLAWAQAPIGP